MEYARRCNVCGKIYCYTDQDLKNNQKNAVVGTASAIGAIASIFGGTTYQTFELNKMSDRSLDKIIDYNKCPNCGSSSTVILTSDELEAYRNNEPVNTTATPQMISINTNASPESLVERGMLFLEDQEWDKANVYFENALDVDPKNVRAYIGKLLVDLHLSKEELLVSCEEDFTDNPNYKKALRFSTEQEKEQLESINKERIYKIAKEVSRTDLKRAIEFLDPIKDYKDVTQLIDSYSETIKSNDYETALSARESQSIFQLSKALSLLEKLGDYRESKKVVAEYQRRIEALKEEQSKRQQAEAQKTAALEEERVKQAAKESEIFRQQKKKEKKFIIIASVTAITIIAAAMVAVKIIVPNNKYNAAVTLMENKDFSAAINAFEELNGYKDSDTMILECLYREAEEAMANGDAEKALNIYSELGVYKDSESKCNAYENAYQETIQSFTDDEVADAIKNFGNVDGGDITYEEVYFPFFVDNRLSFTLVKGSDADTLLCSTKWNAKYYAEPRKEITMIFKEDGSLIETEGDWQNNWDWKNVDGLEFPIGTDRHYTIRKVNDHTLVFFEYDSKPEWVLYK